MRRARLASLASCSLCLLLKEAKPMTNATQHAGTKPAPQVSVRLLREEDLAAADRIVRLAFGTFLGMPDPLSFMGDAGFVHSRWRTDPSAAFAAEVDNALVGTAFATR